MLLGVMTVDLWSFSSSLIRTTDLSVDQEKMQLVKALNNDPEIHRVVAMGDRFQPNDGLLYRYHDIQGYDPLILKRYLAYINMSQNMSVCPDAVNVQYVRRLNSHLIQMLNVKYAISDTGILKLGNHVPRAFIVHNAVTVPSRSVLDFMMSEDFNPAEIVALEDTKQAKKLAQLPTRPLREGENDYTDHTMVPVRSEHCQITEYANNEIRLTVSMKHDGYLIIIELTEKGVESIRHRHIDHPDAIDPEDFTKQFELEVILKESKYLNAYIYRSKI